jgi:hypothetical protein
MKMPRDSFRDLVHRPLDPSVPLVLKRSALRLFIILLFSMPPVSGAVGFRQMFVILTGVNALTCAIWALIRRERPGGIDLTHWDEALIMTFLSLLGSIMN